MPWSTPFDDPISLPDGHKLLTLRDAADYVTGLPKAEHSAPEWQAAMVALILVAETRGPTMIARIGVMRALNRHVEPVYNPDLKMPHWGKRKLKRDRWTERDFSYHVALLSAVSQRTPPIQCGRQGPPSVTAPFGGPSTGSATTCRVALSTD